ncbi:MAG: hypothetical protein JW915_17470 [Chitinispirillaceae bacterium]|nr:hypothetical protein [Chitinispirillaceae bacterium]
MSFRNLLESPLLIPDTIAINFAYKINPTAVKARLLIAIVIVVIADIKKELRVNDIDSDNDIKKMKELLIRIVRCRQNLEGDVRSNVRGIC